MLTDGNNLNLSKDSLLSFVFKSDSPILYYSYYINDCSIPSSIFYFTATLERGCQTDGSAKFGDRVPGQSAESLRACREGIGKGARRLPKGRRRPQFKVNPYHT